jgi:hypothetical protein
MLYGPLEALILTTYLKINFREILRDYDNLNPTVYNYVVKYIVWLTICKSKIKKHSLLLWLSMPLCRGPQYSFPMLTSKKVGYQWGQVAPCHGLSMCHQALVGFNVAHYQSIYYSPLQSWWFEPWFGICFLSPVALFSCIHNLSCFHWALLKQSLIQELNSYQKLSQFFMWAWTSYTIHHPQILSTMPLHLDGVRLT